MESWQEEVDRFCHQYLQLEQILDYPDGEYLKLGEVQDVIMTRLFAAETALEDKPPVRYQVRTLKALVSRIEASIDDWDEHAVNDELMSALAVLASTPSPVEEKDAEQQRKCRVVYHLSSLPAPTDDACITLRESRFLLLAGGTTGLRTWEAALHMGQYLCQNPSVLAGKHVLELGAGTGYLSILCAKYLQSAHVMASDGSDHVVHHLTNNLALNRVESATSVTPMRLRWGHALPGIGEKGKGRRPVDVVLGADITYDAGLISALLETLLDLFRLHPQVEVLIAATQRNQQTFGVFLDGCQLNGLHVENVQFEVPPRKLQQGPFYDDHVAIRICKILKPVQLE